MILESKKLFFRKLNIVLEDQYFDNLIKKNLYKQYGTVVALSYQDLHLLDFQRIVKRTALINLTLKKEDIFSRFNATTRNEIRKTEHNDKLAFKTEDQSFSSAYKLYKEFEFSQGRVPVSLGDFKKYSLFTAYYCGELVSAVSIVDGDNRLRIRSIFSKRLKVENKDLYKIISNSTRRVIWEACKWGKERGFKSLDMASVNLSNPKTSSIARFKMNFGGNLINEYAYIYKSKTFSFFEHFVKIKLFLYRLVERFKKF